MSEYPEVCPCGGTSFCWNPDENHECKGPENDGVR